MKMKMTGRVTSDTAFVKSEQAKVAPMAGKDPKLTAESMKFNAYMCNNGMHAKEFARSLTAGIDEKAFPVK